MQCHYLNGSNGGGTVKTVPYRDENGVLSRPNPFPRCRERARIPPPPVAEKGGRSANEPQSDVNGSEQRDNGEL